MCHSQALVQPVRGSAATLDAKPIASDFQLGNYAYEDGELLSCCSKPFRNSFTVASGVTGVMFILVSCMALKGRRLRQRLCYRQLRLPFCLLLFCVMNPLRTRMQKTNWLLSKLRNAINSGYRFAWHSIRKRNE